MKVWNQNPEMLSPEEVSKKLSGIKDPAVLYQQRVAFQKRKYEELLQKISFLDTHLRPEERRYDYPDDFRPFVFFFKFLARRPDSEGNSNYPKLKLWLPDTVLTSEGDNPPFWLYTSQDGYVHRTDNFTPKNIINKMGNFSSPDELVAVLKKPQARDFAYVGNDIRLLTLKDLSLISQSMVTSRGDIICIQKFVKSVGPKAFICRTCWRKDRNPYVWVITSNKDFYSDDASVPETQKYMTNPKVMNSCTIINSIKGRYVEETTPYVANLVRYLELNIPGAKFEEFVCDFIKDESGTWWLVNIRGFVLVDKMNVYPRVFLGGADDGDYVPTQAKKKKPEGYQKTTMCKYCEGLYPVEELVHKMTLKSIMQTDKHLMHRGKTFKWLERSDLQQIDTAALYQEHKVCNSCYKLHQETEKLREIEFEFARVLGIPVNPDKRPDLVSATTFPTVNQMATLALADQTQVQTPTAGFQTNRATEDANLELVRSTTMALTESVVSPRRELKSKHHIRRYRMMIYLHMVYDIPKDIDASKPYYIEYYIFDQKQRYKVDLSSAFSVNGDILIPINKLRMFFMFSQDRKSINEYINEQKSITLNLYCENEKLGTVSFELNDFLSDNVIKREMFKVFSGKKLPILSWGLKVTIGLIEGGLEDINRVKLAEHKNIYLASPDYYTCEPLPEEWLQVFQENKNHLTQLLGRSELRSSRYSLSISHPDSARRRSRNLTALSISGSQGYLGYMNGSKNRPDTIESSPNIQFPHQPKSLFTEEASDLPIEPKDDEEDLRVVKKILLDSIKDYEKEGTHTRKKSAALSARPEKPKSGHNTARGVSPRIKVHS